MKSSEPKMVLRANTTIDSTVLDILKDLSMEDGMD
jgi:hypothetical protein